MVAEDFLQDPQVRQWLDGGEPTRTLLIFDRGRPSDTDSLSLPDLPGESI
jgi:hypothetical protein